MRQQIPQWATAVKRAKWPGRFQKIPPTKPVRKTTQMGTQHPRTHGWTRQHAYQYSARHALWVTDSIRIAHWSRVPNSLLKIPPHHSHSKQRLLQEVFSIKNRSLTNWISFYGHITTIWIKNEILSSFIQDEISSLILSWKISLNIFHLRINFGLLE